MPEAIIFDLDDTILVYDEAAAERWLEMCQRFIHRLPGFEAEGVFNAISQTADWYWGNPERHRRGRLNLFNARREVVALAFENLGIGDKKTGEMIADAYSNGREEAARPIPGAIDTLTRFRNTVRKLGLITNGASKPQRTKIEKFELAGFFDHIIVEGEFGKGKPEKEVFLTMLEKLDANPAETWMVGDDLGRDIAGAQATGIYTVWVDWRGTGLPETAEVRPDRSVRTISELMQ